ncbi:hypothetical protein J3456_10785 [Sulfitobacter sp. NFXS29]|uniref:hypothetical protein n=1 Tax=Sulfitobacter sp. NFXS29 TaxID=2818438 RepID=UPI0032DE393B
MKDGHLGTAKIDNYRSIHISELSRESIIDNGAEHLGFGGYFLFETNNDRARRGINILARVASLDAGLEMLEIWSERSSSVAIRR